MTDVRSDGTPRHILDAADLPAREHHFASHQHILDSAVQGGKLTDAAGRHKPSHLREWLGLRGMTCRQALFPQAVLQRLEGHTALAGDLHALLVDLENLIHFRTVDDDGILQRCFQAALNGGMTGAGNNVDAVFIGEHQNVSDLFGVLYIYDGGRDGLRVNLVALLKLSVAVDAAFLQYGFIGDYPVFSENVHQTFYDFFPCE